MNKNPLLLLIVGIVMLAAGAFLSLGSGAPKADAATVAQCEARMRDQGPEMVGKCKEQAFATAMTATDADAAARAISAANNSEVGGNMLGMFLLGLGLVVTAAGAYGWWQKNKS